MKISAIILLIALAGLPATLPSPQSLRASVAGGCVALRAGCTHWPGSKRPTVHHIVLCWLKDAGNASQRQQIVQVSRSFRNIPGVLDVRCGQVLPSKRPIVDDSFDVAILVSFADQASLEKYLAHPAHQQAKDDVLLPLVRKIVVYDFTE